MKNDLIKDAFKRIGVKVDSQAVMAEGFFILQGIFAGIALNDVWRILNLPGNNAPLNVAGLPGSFDYDLLYQFLIAGIAAGAEVFFKVEHGLAFAGGIALGSTWANTSEKGAYIGAAPAQAKSPDPKPAPPPIVLQGPYGLGSGTGNTPLTSAPAAPYNPMLVPQLNRPTLT